MDFFLLLVYQQCNCLFKGASVELWVMVYRGDVFVDLGQCDLNRVLAPRVTSLKQVFLGGNRLTGTGKVCESRLSWFSITLEQQTSNSCGYLWQC